ncbi:hypothetical protein Hte_010558 [Hypoxylon texense]
MISKLFLVTLLGSAALASPINLAIRDSDTVTLQNLAVADKRDSSAIVFQDVAVEEKRDGAIVFQDVPVEEKRDSNTIVMGDVPIADESD